VEAPFLLIFRVLGRDCLIFLALEELQNEVDVFLTLEKL
jgi:hypothetical protein